MRLFFVAVLSLLAVTIAKAETGASLPKVLKSDFVKEIALSGEQKLLGWAGDGLYWAEVDGSIEILDQDGKALATLATKDGKETVLKQPEAIAFGDKVVYVVDSELLQVVVFSLTGKHLYSFGAKRGGLFSSSADDLSVMKSPRGIAFHEGVVYVADTDNSRILMFGSNGVFLNALELSPGVAEKNSANKDIYKLAEPTDIAVDYRGRVFVLDANDGLVKFYSPIGEYLGHLPEIIASHFVLAADGLYVAERETLIVHKFDLDAKLLQQFGSKGVDKGQFRTISGMAAGNNGQFFVADVKKKRNVLFQVDTGNPHEAIPKLASLPYVQRQETMANVIADKLAWDGKDTMYGVDSDSKTLIRIRSGHAELIRLKDITPIAVAVDKTGAVWVLDRKNMRVVKLDESGQVVSSFGSAGKGDGQFGRPMDLAISNLGALFVADANNNSVLSFSSDGTFLKALRGSGSNNLEEPVSLSFDAQDNLYVLDRTRASVTVFSAQGEQILNFGKSKSGESSGLIKPTAILALTDEVLVLDGNHVKVFSRQGNYLRTFAAKGKNNGELDGPIALAAKDSVTVLIAERGNKRIQTFAMQYQPSAPQQLKAEAGVHAADLHWAAATQPYIKQYAVYRSKSENGGYERIASSATNHYLDQNLDPQANYFYRVAAVTQFNLEGETSAAVSVAPKIFVPMALDTVQVEATPWQLKLSWKPVDKQYFADYVIYQKEGDGFTKIGETATPEYSKDALTPDSKYVFYITVRSTDTIESEKLAVSGTTQPFNRPPLEIEVLKLRDIFSNTYKLHEQEGVGLIRLTNNTKKPIEQIKSSFIIKNFMDLPAEEKLDKLLPGQSAEIRLKAVFNNNILTLAENTSVPVSIEASYLEYGKRVVVSKNPTLTVYEKHRLMWDEGGRYAAFITPKDAPITAFVNSVINQYKETKDETLLAAAVFNAMGLAGMTFIPDPTNPYQITSAKTDMVDYIQYPRETLERKSGDNDDLVAFYAAALESLGIATRVIEVPGHMLMMFSTGVKADNDAYTMDDMYVWLEDKLWIPVEVTLVGKPFAKAWEAGSINYHKGQDNGLTMLNVEEEWQTYKPALLPETSLKAIDVTREAIEKRYPNEFSSLQKISTQTRSRRYLQIIAKNPSDVDAHLQLGIIMAKAGDNKEAMNYFDKVLSLDPKNSVALNNRGDLLMTQENYKEAQKAYLMAAQATPKDAEIWIKLTKAYDATNDTAKAKEAFTQAQVLDPSVKSRYKELAK